MARVSTYLNFPGTTEEAFNFYAGVFGTELSGEITRMGDMPPDPGQPELSDTDKKLVMHIMLPILDGHILMGTDATQSMGFTLSEGNNTYINLEPDTLDETKRLYEALSAGGKIETELQHMPWGAYYAAFKDKYGINWMLNCGDQE